MYKFIVFVRDSYLYTVIFCYIILTLLHLPKYLVIFEACGSSHTIVINIFIYILSSEFI